MTTPLGTIDVQARAARRVRLARKTRETDVTVTLDLDGTGAAEIATGIGFYDHLLGSLAHHGLFDLEIAATGDLHVDEHHTVEDVALVLGSAFAEALGDRAGIRRFGDSSVPMDESVATAVVDVGGRPYAVIDLPFRAERAGTLPLQLVEHALEAFARTAGATVHVQRHRPQRPPPRRGRVQGARARAARRVRARPAADRRRVDEGLAGMTGALTRGARRRRGGRLRRGQPRLDRAGAARRGRTRPSRADARRPRRRRPPRRAGRRGRGAGDGPAAGRRVRRPDPRLDRRRPPVPRDLPRAPAPVRGQRRGRRRDPGRAAGAHGPPRRRPDPAPHRLEPGRPDPAAPRVRRHRRRRGLLLRPLVRGRAARTATPRHRLPATDHGRPFVSAVARGRMLGVQFHPERSGADGLRLIANVVGLAARARAAA